MKYFCTLFLLLIVVSAQAQENTTNVIYDAGDVQPFMFSVNSLTNGMKNWNLAYSGGYGKRVDGPFGYDGLDQQFALGGYLGNKFTIYANMGLGFGNDGKVNSFEQMEVLRDILGGNMINSSRLSLGLGVRREWNNDGVVFSRISGILNKDQWRAIGNLRIEKAFSKGRDAVDIISTLGYHHEITNTFFAGLEVVGEDLEGFWNPQETEGGAKMLIGPSVDFRPSELPFSISICGGPAFHATQNKASSDNGAIRDLGTAAINDGFTLRFAVNYAF